MYNTILNAQSHHKYEKITLIIMLVKENIKINKIFLIQEKINKLCGMWEKLESVQDLS